ncbi:MAG: NUDIX hydrolase [Solirubrobacterales bacterium]
MPDARSELQAALLTSEQARAIEAHGSRDAAVLLPLYGLAEEPTLVFTKRRSDLSQHAGEISFPGGRPEDGDTSLLDAALREAHEEVGLGRDHVDVVGALPPTPTLVTDYRVQPYVGLIPADTALEPEPGEVEAILRFTLDDLVAGYGRRRLVKRGVPFRSPTYEVDGELIWGATARILGTFLERFRG